MLATQRMGKVESFECISKARRILLVIRSIGHLLRIIFAIFEGFARASR